MHLIDKIISIIKDKKDKDEEYTIKFKQKNGAQDYITKVLLIYSKN